MVLKHANTKAGIKDGSIKAIAALRKRRGVVQAVATTFLQAANVSANLAGPEAANPNPDPLWSRLGRRGGGKRATLGGCSSDVVLKTRPIKGTGDLISCGDYFLANTGKKKNIRVSRLTVKERRFPINERSTKAGGWGATRGLRRDRQALREGQVRKNTPSSRLGRKRAAKVVRKDPSNRDLEHLA